MWYANYLKDFVQNLLPDSSELIILEEPHKRPAIIVADLDGDMIPEIITAYKLQGESYIAVLKSYNNLWSIADSVKSEGYNVSYLELASVTEKNSKNIVVGWQVGAIWSRLDIFEWKDLRLKELIDEDIVFSKIDVKDIPSSKGRDGKEEIALWIHDTGESYKVEVYRWINRKLVPHPDVYPHYFKKVASYYEWKVKEYPDYAFYWYYLADAQLKVGILNKALKSVDTAINLNKNYPPKEELLTLKKEILSKFNLRAMNLYPASVKTIGGTKWGYINYKGSFIIKPIYDYAMNFQDNGLAVVQVGNLNGVINVHGKYVVEPKYDSINQFSEGRAAVIDKGIFKIIDESGREITEKGYSFIGIYKEGRVLASDILKEYYVYGYLDREGKEIIPLKYKAANDFKNGKTIVQIEDNKFALINLKGDILKIYNYASVGPIGENGLLAYREVNDEKYGYINESGTVIIKPQYSQALPFEQGRAVVNAAENFNNKYGLIDAYGNFIINPEYNEINLIGEDKVAIGKAIDEEEPYMGSEFAIADIDGNIFTSFIYYSVNSYNQGFTSVSDKKNTFFIDRNGKLAQDLPIISGDGTLSMEDNLIRANIDMRTFYVDRSGNIIWSQNIVIPINNQYKIIEGKFKPNKDYIVYYPQVEGINDKSTQQSVNNKLKELSQVKEIPKDEQLDFSYTGDFSVEFFKNNLLILELDAYEFYFGAAHGMPTKVYPHIDLVMGRFYELKDLFKQGSNYVKILSDIIGEQIKNDPQYSYVFPDSYKGITENQPFYVSEDSLYIYFVPYEIAPYAAGFPTFKISYSQIMNIINVDGEFWKSFN